jgi:hypothetical protein
MLNARKSNLEAYVAEAEQLAKDSVASGKTKDGKETTTYEQRMVAFLKEKEAANKLLWEVFNGKAGSEREQVFFEASKKAWGEGVPDTLSKLEDSIKGLYALGDQVVSTDLYGLYRPRSKAHSMLTFLSPLQTFTSLHGWPVSSVWPVEDPLRGGSTNSRPRLEGPSVRRSAPFGLLGWSVAASSKSQWAGVFQTDAPQIPGQASLISLGEQDERTRRRRRVEYNSCLGVCICISGVTEHDRSRLLFLCFPSELKRLGALAPLTRLLTPLIGNSPHVLFSDDRCVFSWTPCTSRNSRTQRAGVLRFCRKVVVCRCRMRLIRRPHRTMWRSLRRGINVSRGQFPAPPVDRQWHPFLPGISRRGSHLD